MAIKLRPTGLGSGIDKDRPDYTVYCGEWRVGRISSAYGLWEVQRTALRRASAGSQAGRSGEGELQGARGSRDISKDATSIPTGG